MGTLMMKVLMIEYGIIAIAFAYDHDWPRCGYFVSALGITASVLWIK